jgi:hypothetical protein
MVFGWMRVGIVDIRARTDGNKHGFSVGRELNVTRPVAAAIGQIGDVLRSASGLQIAALVAEAHDRVGVGYVYPFRIRAWRVKGNAKRTV